MEYSDIRKQIVAMYLCLNTENYNIEDIRASLNKMSSKDVYKLYAEIIQKNEAFLSGKKKFKTKQNEAYYLKICNELGISRTKMAQHPLSIEIPKPHFLISMLVNSIPKVYTSST